MNLTELKLHKKATAAINPNYNEELQELTKTNMITISNSIKYDISKGITTIPLPDVLNCLNTLKDIHKKNKKKVFVDIEWELINDEGKYLDSGPLNIVTLTNLYYLINANTSKEEVNIFDKVEFSIFPDFKKNAIVFKPIFNHIVSDLKLIMSLDIEIKNAPIKQENMKLNIMFTYWLKELR